MSIIVEPCRYPDTAFLYVDEQVRMNCRIFFTISERGGMPVKKDGRVLVVHCFFTEEGEKLPELVRQSLRLFIERNLRNMVKI